MSANNGQWCLIKRLPKTRSLMSIISVNDGYMQWLDIAGWWLSYWRQQQSIMLNDELTPNSYLVQHDAWGQLMANGCRWHHQPAGAGNRIPVEDFWGPRWSMKRTAKSTTVMTCSGARPVGEVESCAPDPLALMVWVTVYSSVLMAQEWLMNYCRYLILGLSLVDSF